MVLSFCYLGKAAEAKDSQCVQFENLQLQATLKLLFSAQAWTRWGLSQGVCVCVCVCAFVSVCESACVCLCVCVIVCMCVCVCVCPCLGLSLSVSCAAVSAGGTRPAQLFSSSRKKQQTAARSPAKGRARPSAGGGDEKEKDLPTCAGGCAPLWPKFQK